MKNFSILLIDDVPENIYTLKLLIEDNFEDVYIYEASSVNEAVVCIMENQIDLILSDIQMPGTDGFDLVHYLKGLEQTKEIPIILVTAIYDSINYEKKGYKLGALDYLHKPIDEEILCSKLKLYIGLYKQKKENKEELSEKDKLLLEQIKINSHVATIDGSSEHFKEYKGFLYEEDSQIDFDKILAAKNKLDNLMKDDD